MNILFIDGVPQIVDRPGFKGLGYDLALDVNLTRRMSLAVTAGRNTIANGVVGAQFTVANTWSAGLDYQLGRRFTVGLGVNGRKSQYRGAFNSPLDPTRRISDDFSRYYAQFGGRIGQHMTFAFDVSHNKRRSNPRFLDFNSTSVGLSLGYRFGRGS